MKTIQYIMCLGLLSLPGLSSCGGHTHEEEGAGEGHHHHEDEIVLTEAQAKAAQVATEKVAAGDFSEIIKTGGRILAASGRERVVSATVSGIVGYPSGGLTPGMLVSAGQHLFSITSKGLPESATAGPALAELERARRAYERANQLAADKVISRKELEQAEADLRSAKAAAAAPGVKAASGSVGISSPMAGWLVSLDVAPGAYVEAGATLATVSSDRTLRLQADVSERKARDIASVRGANIVDPATGSVVEVSGPGVSVTASGAIAADAPHYVPVTLEFANPGQLVSGSYVEVYLLGAPRRGVISVPRAALTEEMGAYYVYVKTGHDVYEKRLVEPGVTDGARVEIRSGLKNGDEVVVAGAYAVRMAAQSGTVPAHNHNH